MALFTVLTTAAQLPLPGTSRETGTFDFKARPDPQDQRELAKDIAAFANATGGVLLAGAQEDRASGSLSGYVPLSLAEAQEIKRAYEESATTFCSPNPVFDPVVIERVRAEFVVAVNVYAFPVCPVAVRWVPGEPAWTFPLRTATQTHWMSPTEAIMLAIPAIRRAAILLDAIPLRERQDVVLLGADAAAPYVGKKANLRFSGVDALASSATFEETVGIAGIQKTSIPLDAVQSVWKGNDGKWCVALTGCIGKGATGWYYWPRL